jgi:hypothetical protein
LAAAVTLAAVAAAEARPAEPRTSRTPDTANPIAAAARMGPPATITLDGRLDDAAWQQVVPTSGFRQRDPREGADPSFPTEFRVACDERALYVAVMAFDPEPQRIVGLRTRRDSDSPSDWIRVLVDSWHDRLSAFEFAVNPAGVRQDRYWFNDSSNDDGWDAVWDVAVSRDERGWSAEFRIPLSQLRFAANEEGRFGFAVVRHIARLNETTSWPLLPRSAQGYVSSFGQLSGLSLGRSTNRLEIVPYAVADFTTQPPEPGNELAEPRDPGGQAGLDFKYALTPGVTLTGTVNPDFGQVEADPAVVNLSAFETFFAERRPFFVEGSGLFRFDLDCEDDQCTGLFYSRRIGRNPRGEPEAPDGGYTAQPSETTILGAAKLTGRAGAYSFGALTAVTADERATLLHADGSRTRALIEPATSYTVVRARREWADQSSVGGMVTSANRRVPGTLDDLLPSQAHAGGIDADWRLARGLRLSGYWAASTVRGEAAAIESIQEDARHLFQRPDADYVSLDPSRTSLGGHAGMLAFSKIAGERVRFNTNVSFKTPGFDVNELGFLRRADQRQVGNWLQIRHDRPWRFLRTARLNLNQWIGWNYGGDRLYSGANVNAHFTFTNNWRTGFGTTRQFRTFDDRHTRGGPGAYRDPRVNGWGYVATDERRLISAGMDVFGMRDDNGLEVWELAPSVTVRPSSALSASLNLLLAQNRDPAQWIEQVDDAAGPHYVFGGLDQKTTALAFRVNYAVSPTLTVQLYGRPFVSAGAYDGYRELIDGRASHYEDRYAPFEYGSDADFHYRSFRMTNVMRWEYRPGSTLFVVWQQGREQEDAVVGRARDLGDAFSPPARNVFLVKLAYWINP